MKMMKQITAALLCLMFCALTLLCAGCSSKKEPSVPSGESEEAETKIIGQGAVEVTVKIVGEGGKETVYLVRTDDDVLGKVLEESGLIAGEHTATGLYIKTVDGVTADYVADGKYWAFFVNGEYAMTGVDTTPVTSGSIYEFRLTNADENY